MREKTVVVNLRQGFHIRPATQFVKAASAFKSAIRLKKNGNTADAASIVGLIALGIKNGDEVVLSADGPDEQEAIAVLEGILKGGE